MAYSKVSRKWCVFFFLVSLLTHWAWVVLWVLQDIRGLIGGSWSIFSYYGNCFLRVCLSVRPDKFLSSYCNY